MQIKQEAFFFFKQCEWRKTPSFGTGEYKLAEPLGMCPCQISLLKGPVSAFRAQPANPR